ncbi:MAG: hypothetical protein H6640_04525 [Caldilineaceae bacterium]|nr:hypothetical protein [Caldilineaceae bacterium]
MTQSFQAYRRGDDRVNEELAVAEQEYLDVLGTDEQKYARAEVDRIKKELRKEEEAILWEILPEAFAAVLRRASALRVCATMTCRCSAAWCCTAGPSPR